MAGEDDTGGVRDLASLSPEGPFDTGAPLMMQSSLELSIDKLLWLIFEGHALRVMQFTVDVCKRMGIRDRAQLRSARRGALLHDVGKIGVPDRIIMKSGPLNPVEWHLMRQHPRWGYQLLIAHGELHTDWVIPFCHHERWDGSGYPRGLRAEEIPIEARAFAPIDVFDALTEPRPYREALLLDETWRLLEAGRGTQFDPRALDAFRTIWETSTVEREDD